MDGNEENYEFPRQKTDESIIVKKIQESLESKYLIIDLKTKVQVIPIHSILSIEITPPPLRLPSNTIRGASLV
jgi:hypothetical protein